jgi:hypothetical protein
MKGDTKVAPARAASRAWLALKHKVTFTMVPPWVSAAGLESVPCQRHFHGDVRRQFGQMTPFADHAVGLERGDFGAHRALDEAADLLDHLLEVPARLGDERRIGGHPVDEAHRDEFADLVRVGRVGKELHGKGLESWRRKGPQTSMLGTNHKGGRRLR